MILKLTNTRLLKNLVDSALILSALFASPEMVVAVDDLSSHSSHEIELIGVAEIAGNDHDRSGLSEMLDEDSSNDLVGGFSGLEYSGQNDVYYLLSDRGPKDGAVNWICRVQRVSITINPGSNAPVKTSLLETMLLTDEAGRPFTGLATAFASDANHTMRLDPEGIRVGTDGHLFVSDEYGPHLLEFSATGRLLRQLSVPEKFLVKTPSEDPDKENSLNTSGRHTNRGMEGLAISSDKKTLFGLLQSPLIQDCLTSDPAQRWQGLNCRLLQTSVADGAEKELLYPLDSADNKLNEILAIGPHTFLVIERDGEEGTASKFKKLMLIRTKDATDISDLEQLPIREIPPHVVPVIKSVLIDLLDPRWNLAGEKMPEKIEGLAFGPELPDGRRTLLVCSDNDFIQAKPTVLYVFAVPSPAFDQELATHSSPVETAVKGF